MLIKITVFCLALFHFFDLQGFSSETPYFSYSQEELENLRKLPLSTQILTRNSFIKWDPIIYQLINEDKRLKGESKRFMAYFYASQNDFAQLSFISSKKLVGDPSALLIKIIHLFYPAFSLPQTSETDPFSQKLSDLIFGKIEARIQLEESQFKEYSSPSWDDQWMEKPPFLGLGIGSCKPWLLKNINEFLAPFPPGTDSIIWIYGIEQIKDAQAHLTSEQLQLIKYWAGEFGPDSGNWYAIVNQELSARELSLSDFLMIRAVFAMGFLDAQIVVFDSKYTYWVRRPTMLSSEIIPIVPVPKHPSYPSAHSALSSTAAVILSHYFPDKKQKWQKMAIQAGNTRIWGGLHFVYDHEQGLIQGEKVGNEVIKNVIEVNSRAP